MSFTFENLTVYQKSIEMVEHIESLNKNLKGQVSFSLMDQLSRASLSVALNIAEGNGRWHKNEKKQFLRIAQGSVFETVPILQVLLRRKLLEKSAYQTLYQKQETIAKMLTNLIKAVDSINRVN